MPPELKPRPICDHTLDKKNNPIHGHTFVKGSRKRIVQSIRFRCLKCGKTYSQEVIENYKINPGPPRLYSISRNEVKVWKKTLKGFTLKSNKSESNYFAKIENQFNWKRRHSLFLIRQMLDELRVFNKKNTSSAELSLPMRKKYNKYLKFRPLLKEPAFWFLQWKLHKNFLVALTPIQKSRVQKFLNNVNNKQWASFYHRLDNELGQVGHYHSRRLKTFFSPYTSHKEIEDDPQASKTIAKNFIGAIQ